jgi:hypothetical protein
MRLSHPSLPRRWGKNQEFISFDYNVRAAANNILLKRFQKAWSVSIKASGLLGWNLREIGFC